jgi:hypothetical protein
MVLYSIILFPKFEDSDVIKDIRKKYDPSTFPTHITLMYALHTKYNDKQVKEKVQQILNQIKPFEVQLKGINKSVKNYYGKKNTLSQC